MNKYKLRNNEHYIYLVPMTTIYADHLSPEDGLIFLLTLDEITEVFKYIEDGTIKDGTNFALTPNHLIQLKEE